MSDPASPLPPSRLSRRAVWADGLLAVFVVVFAFLAASFAARNSDLWLHLAAGRLIVQGGYTFGVDPFAYTTDGIYWANHAWLFDAALYVVFSSFGGEGVVILKAAGIALLAAVMLRTARSATGPFWVSAACTLLAVLAMSPRLLVQPACLSVLMLAVTQCLLVIGGRRAHIALPIVIALWVNLDGWFLLGPLLVALFWLGQRLTPSAPRMPVWVLPACFAACLVSPHHIYALTLPPELSPAVWGSELRDDPRFANLFASPWRFAPLGRSGGYSLSTWAYFVLLGVGLFSFALNRRAVLGWRGLVWLSFAGLSAWQVRLAPFFAVAAGPIAALNLRVVLKTSVLDRHCRAVVGLVTIALSVLTWPGWLQSFYARDRALSWSVEADPTLVVAAEQLEQSRQAGEMSPEAHVFPAHPDLAHYMAWYAPHERVFVDSRFQLFTGVGGEYVRLSRMLGIIPGDAAGWQEDVRKRHLTRVMVYDPDPIRQATALHAMTSAPGQWVLVSVDGTAVVFADKGALDSRSAIAFDAERFAFGPPNDAILPMTPLDGPSRLPPARRWWDLAASRMKGRTAEGDAAIAYLRLFEVTHVPTATPPKQPDRSPALPLLAVRGARCAVAKNPDSDDAWLTLARAYLTLGRETWETTGEMTPRGFLRHAQTAAALFSASLLNPDSLAIHESLAALYSERQFTDLTLEQLRIQLHLVRRAGAAAGESAEDYAQRVAFLQEAIEQTEDAVQDAENLFLVRTAKLAGDPLGRARVARDLGLAGKAIDVLLKSHPDLYGAAGLRILLDLLLGTGQVEAAGALLEREELVRNPGSLDIYELPGGVVEGRRWSYQFPAYDWFVFVQSAAAGRYERANSALERIREWYTQRETILTQAAAKFSWQLGSETLLAVPPSILLNRLLAARNREVLTGHLFQIRMLTINKADMYTLAGMLMIERGAPTEAVAEFNRAIALYKGAKDAATNPSGLVLSTRYVDVISRQIHPKRP